MKKFLVCILSLLFISLPLSAEELLDNVQLPMRDYDGIELKAGVFIPVMNAQEISTQYCPLGYKVKFIATDDMFLHETNIIPKGTEFYGYIEDIHEPVVGTNASMKIKITKMTFADGFEVPLKANVYVANSSTIGGELTPPEKYVTVPHYQQKFQGRFWTRRGAALQIRPGGKRKMGEHKRLQAGEEFLIVLTSPAWITHTLTN